MIYNKNNIKWPTLDGRLNQPITSELEALEQLEKTLPLTNEALKKIELLRKERLNQPRVTLKEAQEQAKRVMAASKKSKKQATQNGTAIS